MRRRAFTLIELLIVVAIIAILAAIAVPNFLEAQTRSKVSRVLADHRSLATAIEAYHVDENRYPTQPVFPLGLIDEPIGLSRLSTPVAYITDPLIRDPFKVSGDVSSNNQKFLQYIYQETEPVLGGSPRGIFEVPISFELANGKRIRDSYPAGLGWFLISYGPDRALQFDDDPAVQPNRYYMPYDPTNGTVSAGDIFRFGP